MTLAQHLNEWAAGACVVFAFVAALAVFG